MFDPKDEYAGMTWKQYDRMERAERMEREENARQDRLDAFRAGLVSRAAVDDERLYEQELAEAGELVALTEQTTGISTEGIAAPLAQAISGFFNALAAARKAA